MAKTCKVCGKRAYSEYCMQHKPRKPIEVRTPIKRQQKPIKFESDKARAKRLDTTERLFAANPPDPQGRWRCYISKHPQCPVWLTKDTINLEHDISKARDKSRQHDITNIFPACRYDNKAKGSLSAKEYLAL